MLEAFKREVSAAAVQLATLLVPKDNEAKN